MKYKNSFNLCVCFMMVFILETASERRQKQICIPCSEFNERNICGSNQTDICITDKKQLQVLKKIVNGLTAEVTRQTVQVTRETKLPESENIKERRAKERRDCVFSYIVLPGFFLGNFIVAALLCIISRKKRQSESYMKRNKSDHQNKTTKLLLRESYKCDGPELSIRRSLFKKSSYATFSRSELEKLKISMQSVGILFRNNTGQGTVIRIGIKYILTAWHVIEPIVSTPGRVDNHGKAINSMNVEALKNDTVCVDFSEDTRNGESHCQFRLLPKICFLDKNLDVCVLEVDGEVTGLPKPINIFRDFYSMNIGSTHKFVHVIGQDPETSNIVVDPRCRIILHDDKKIKQAKKWIKEHKRDILRHNDMEIDLQQTYDEVLWTREHLILSTFLEFGASGGAVLSFTPDGEVALVAILMRRLPSWFWTYGSGERGFNSIVHMEVACPIAEILCSKEWKDSRRERIFGQSGHYRSNNYTGDKMETDQSARGAFDVFGVTRHDAYTNGNAMETDQLERDAVDNKMSQISLKETC